MATTEPIMSLEILERFPSANRVQESAAVPIGFVRDDRDAEP
jgi:hypothetical protein